MQLNLPKKEQLVLILKKIVILITIKIIQIITINRKKSLLNIKDTGNGIDSKTFPHLFSKFFSTSGIGGTGLGLYICKSIVDAHGGKIWAKNNEDGKGATFSFSLPLYKEQ